MQSLKLEQLLSSDSEAEEEVSPLDLSSQAKAVDLTKAEDEENDGGDDKSGDNSAPDADKNCEMVSSDTNEQ